jgi:hypothetical protein
MEPREFSAAPKPKPMTLEELTKQAELFRSQLSPEVLERIRIRSALANECKARYWAHTTCPETPSQAAE